MLDIAQRLATRDRQRLSAKRTAREHQEPLRDDIEAARTQVPGAQKVNMTCEKAVYQ